MFQHMIQSFNASSLSQRLLLAIPLDFSLPADPCEAGEAVPSEAAPSAPGDIGWDGNRDGSKYWKRVFKKKKRKVNGKATLFYGDLMGHSFGFIWMCLKMDDNGYSPAKLPLDKAICQNWLTDLADLEGSQ
jgi:hypothetical protein